MLVSLYLLLLLEMFQISRSVRITYDGSFMLIHCSQPHSPSSIVIVMYLLIHVFLVLGRFVGLLYVRGKCSLHLMYHPVHAEKWYKWAWRGWIWGGNIVEFNLSSHVSSQVWHPYAHPYMPLHAPLHTPLCAPYVHPYTYPYVLLCAPLCAHVMGWLNRLKFIGKTNWLTKMLFWPVSCVSLISLIEICSFCTKLLKNYPFV